MTGSGDRDTACLQLPLRVDADFIHRRPVWCGVFGGVFTWMCGGFLEQAPVSVGFGCVWWVEQTYVAERSISPSTGVERWVVAEAHTYELHAETCAFLAGLRSKGRSPNTERVYAGRLALYLNYCAEHRIEWSGPSFLALSGLQQWLVTTPLPSRSHRSAAAAAAPRYRSQGTANAVMTAVTDFLRFGALHGWVPSQTAGLLSEPKFLRYLPAGYDPGERGQWRQVQVSAFRFPVSEPGYEDLSPGQIRSMIADAPRARDRFLVGLLAATGLRIGEALGLRQEDLHFLASSRSLGCPVEGPHLHVRRRMDNPNRALAKSRHPRFIPVTSDLVSLYTDYQHERNLVAEAAGTGMVFVNLFRLPLGRAMTYPNAKDVFDRLAGRAGHPARPHILRHSAATHWLRGGVDRDVVQKLLGHASPLSMDRYRHVDESETRAAVDRAQAWRQNQ